ncbi:hypothetical protein OSTOST_19753, partial [Ostertagia ostertagi]
MPLNQFTSKSRTNLRSLDSIKGPFNDKSIDHSAGTAHRCFRNDIVVGVEIRFEQIRFPAVTICNMNPYKNSLARQSSSIKSARGRFVPDQQMYRPCDLLTCTVDGITIIMWWIQKETSDVCVIPLIFLVVHQKVTARHRAKQLCSSFPMEQYYWNCAPEREIQIQACPNDTASPSPTLCYCQKNNYCIEVENQIKIRVRRGKTRVYEKILSQYEGILAVYSMCTCKSDLECIAIKEK